MSLIADHVYVPQNEFALLFLCSKTRSPSLHNHRVDILLKGLSIFKWVFKWVFSRRFTVLLSRRWSLQFRENWPGGRYSTCFPGGLKFWCSRTWKKSRNYSIARNQIEVAPGTGVLIIPRLRFRSHGNSQHREDDTRFSGINHKAWCLNQRPWEADLA